MSRATAVARALVVVAATLAAAAAPACARQIDERDLRSPAKAAAADTAAASAGDMFPTPFTAAQIRDATKPGRTYRFRVEADGKPPGERVITFAKVDEAGAEVSTNGAPPERTTWEELRKHAEFPKPVVSTREEKITVPAGTFDCVVYVVQGVPGEVRTFYFAKTLPGAPVLFFTEKDGKRLMTSTLVEHRSGA